jgi:hypothetical protein
MRAEKLECQFFFVVVDTGIANDETTNPATEMADGDREWRTTRLDDAGNACPFIESKEQRVKSKQTTTYHQKRRRSTVFIISIPCVLLILNITIYFRGDLLKIFFLFYFLFHFFTCV